MSPKVLYALRRGLTPLQNSIKVLQDGAYRAEDRITPGSLCVGGRKGQAQTQPGGGRGKKETMWRWIFNRAVTANEDALLINLLLKKKNERRVSEDA